MRVHLIWCLICITLVSISVFLTQRLINEASAGQFISDLISEHKLYGSFISDIENKTPDVAIRKLKNLQGSDVEIVKATNDELRNGYFKFLLKDEVVRTDLWIASENQLIENIKK